MSAPTLFFGGSGSLFEADSGYTDGGNAYEMRARTNALAPLGPSKEATFPGAYVWLKFNMTFSIRVIPVLDDVPFYDEAVEIRAAASPAEPQIQRFDLAFMRPNMRDGVEMGRYAFRGTHFALEFAMPCPTQAVDGELHFLGMSLQYDPIPGSGQ